MLSAALQTGNAHVATHGAADLLLHSYRAGVSGGASRGPGRNQLRRTAREAAAAGDFGSIVHADYRSARIGVRGVVAA